MNRTQLKRIIKETINETEKKFNPFDSIIYNKEQDILEKRKQIDLMLDYEINIFNLDKSRLPELKQTLPELREYIDGRIQNLEEVIRLYKNELKTY